MLGYSEEELTTLKFTDITHPEDVKLGVELTEKMRRGEIPSFSAEKRYIKKNGETLLARLTAFYIRDREGAPIYSVAMIEDITEQKRIEQALQESEERYRLLIERQRDGLCIVDLEERFVFCNPAGEEIFGMPPGGLVGRYLHEFTTPGTFSFVRKQTEKRRSGESSTYEFEIVRPNGETRQLHATGTPWLDKGERVVASLAIFRDETNRRLSEQALKASELKYRTLFENTPHGIYQNTPDGRILTANPALVRMLGYDSESELLAADIARDVYVNPEDRKAWMRRLEEGGELRDAELVLRRKDGRELIGLDSGHVVRDEQGRTLYYEGTITDITERKGMEDELRLRAQELNALQETVLDITGRHDLPTLLNSIVERAARLLDAPSGGMYLCDPERQVVRCVVGYSTKTNPVGTVLKYGDGAAGIVAETGKPLIIDDYRTWSSRAAVFERDQPFSAVLSVPMIWQGQVTGVIHVLDNKETRRFTQTDLELLSMLANHAAIAVENARLLEQEQRHAEELTRYSTNLEQQVLERTSKLAESERRFRELADLLPQIVFEIDEQGNLTFLNHIGFAKTGYGEDDLRRGLSAFQMFPPEEHNRAMQKIRKLLGGEKASNDEYTILGKDDGTFPAIVYAAPVMRENRAVGLRGIVIDITERKQMEERLVKSERFAAIGELAAMVGHDLRNPLQGITGALHLLKQESLAEKERDEMFRLIQDNVEYADAIVRDLSDYSAEIQLSPVETTAKSIIAQAIQAARIPEKITVEYLSEEDVTIRVDPDRMKRVFINLIENAVDAMPHGGTLTIESKQLNGDVEITFSDSGQGMPQTVMENLWKPLQTTKAKGLGLGLAICNRIVDAHGGHISVESKAGEGTTVTVSIATRLGEAEVTQK
jgi:PAS domain S-box-containing protein